MVIGIGTDIVQIDRIAKVLERQGDKFAQRILTLTEQQEFARLDNSVAFLAKRFAAKEAVAKALGTGIGHGVSFQDITVIKDNKGAPAISLSGGAELVMLGRGASQVLLSLADEVQYAIAYAILI